MREFNTEFDEKIFDWAKAETGSELTITVLSAIRSANAQDIYVEVGPVTTEETQNIGFAGVDHGLSGMVMPLETEYDESSKTVMLHILIHMNREFDEDINISLGFSREKVTPLPDGGIFTTWEYGENITFSFTPTDLTEITFC